jgi:predicted DCC family thiol-disulfide oxidoreductase YuxK
VDATTDNARCTVYYDGDCPICSREIATYRQARGSEAIDWIDASRCGDTALGPGIDRAAVLQRFHVRGADGTLISGAAAFVEIWKHLPAFAWLARIGARPRVLAVLDTLYAGFLRLRRLWYTPPAIARDAARGKRRP